MTTTAFNVSDFKSSQAYAEMNSMRRDIRRSKLISNNKRAFLLEMVNMWFYWRNNTGEIHPGVTKLCKRLALSERTVRSFLAEFRSLGVLIVKKFAKGGKNATHYAVDLGAVLNVVVPHNVVTVPGELVEFDQGHLVDAEQPEYDEEGLPVLDSHPSDFIDCSTDEKDDTTFDTPAKIADDNIGRASLIVSKSDRPFTPWSIKRHRSPSRVGVSRNAVLPYQEGNNPVRRFISTFRRYSGQRNFSNPAKENTDIAANEVRHA
ncbi:hypothetical protein V6767_20205 [Martelella sp. FLE1502]